MASGIGEAAIGKICEMAIEMAVHKLAGEADLIVNFREDFRWLREELTSLTAFLEDADRQSRHKDDIKLWLHNLREIAMRAEDISEVCALQSMYGNDGQSCGFSFNQWTFRYKIGRQIRDMKVSMTKIIEKANQLSLCRAVLAADVATTSDVASTSQVARPVNRRKSGLLPRDSHPVGIKPKVDLILNWLNDPHIPLIAVVGMGGLGKTYLLQHVFNLAKERYEIPPIWLSISQAYSIFNLQKDLAIQLKDKEFSESIENSENEQTRAQMIHERLERIRCLVVLDDVWEASREDDLLDRLGLPCVNNSRCKVLVSTRNRGVCTNLNAKIYEMQYLLDEESWSLFCFYAFRDYGGHAPQQQLEEEGRKIVEQCGNLPLAVRTIAASLADTTNLSTWEWKLHQLEQVNVSAAENRGIMAILKLSYDSLPTRLKTCFAYLSFFPEDQVIDAEYLITLWIGEGFIPGGEHQLDEAWDCLHQLANLSLLQLSEVIVESENFTWGLTSFPFYYKVIKQCKIHDLLLDLAIQISRENRCAFSREEACAITSDGTAWSRILLAKKPLDANAMSHRRPVCLRTLSLSESEIKSTPKSLFSAMRGLRVLDLSGTDIFALPASVGKLRLLKVLNLRSTDVSEVPECVKHLKSLFFLALPSSCHRLPVWISNFKCLQHLECEGVEEMPKGISKVGSLRTLRSGYLRMSAEENEMMGLHDLANMTHLQELHLQVWDEMELKRVEEVGVLAKLVKMCCLSLYPITGAPHIPENMIAMKHLESLILSKFVVPTWICGFENLRELSLDFCDLSGYPELQRLPSLVLLSLRGGLECRELPKDFGKSGGFPRLRFFTIGWCEELEEFPDLEEGAMACLEVLKIESCPNLKRVGEGLEQLKTLTELFVIASGVVEACREGGEYHDKIKANNPDVKIISRFF